MPSSPASPDPAPTSVVTEKTGLPELSPDEIEQEDGLLLDNIVPTRGYEMLPLVGLGGSAGSIKALLEFFRAMPAESGMAFVVILHLSAEHESTLPALLGRATTMTVVQAQDAQKVQANCVYVIPPGKHISCSDGHLRLTDAEKLYGKRVAVDLFFRTLADTHGPHSAAVVLSGADGDGALGIKRIKERGGLTIAQDPDEAEHDSMPRSAIATGMVDWVLDVAQMPARLLEYREHERRLQLPPEEGPQPAQAPRADPDASEEALRDVLNFLRTRTGRDFSYYKRATIVRRISRRMQVNGTETVPAYFDFLRTHPGESGALQQDLLISVTNFFRDREAFEVLEAGIAGLFHGKRTGDTVRVWVAACATGEEAYSIAMLLCEYAGRLDSPPSLQVFATDLDEEVISHARQGHYPDVIAADVSVERLRRFFIKEPHGYRVRREVREIVLFAVHDLLKDSPFSRLDLVSCRNLLIYLNHDAQARALDIFHFALNSGGRLFLGTSETVDGHSAVFNPLDKKYRFYERVSAGRSALPMPLGPSSPALALAAQERVHGRGAISVPGRNFAQPGGEAPSSVGLLAAGLTAAELPPGLSWPELHFQLIERFAPPSVIVNADHEIVHLSESAGQFLQFTGGEPTVNLLRVVHPMLRIELRATLFRAAQTGEPAETFRVPLEIDGIRRAVDLRVSPAREIAPGFLLVVFDVRDPAAAENSAGAALADRPPEPLVEHLAREIEQVKGHLRDTVEQYEASTEELKASNEELQAMNEELRSATEELETSREELQSINEELSTVNQELKSKVEELGHANSDLQNLMAATAIATIFLDRSLRIMRYTPPAVALFNLIPGDVGRPLSDLRHRLDFPQLRDEAQAVLERLVPTEREVRGQDDRWFLARALPYRSQDDRIEGVVLTFIDISARKAAELSLSDTVRELAQKTRLFDTTLSSIADFAYIFDRDGRFLYANQTLADLLDMPLDKLVGKNFHELPYPPELAAKLMGQIRHIFETGGTLRDETPYTNPADQAAVYEYIFRPVFAADGVTVEFVAGSTRDITERKRMEATLEASREQLRLIVENAREYAIVSLDLQRRVTSWNPGAEALAGYNEAEILGQTADVIFTPEDRAAHAPEHEVLTALAEGRAMDERWHVRKDGTQFWGSGAMMAMHDAHGENVGLVKIFRDQTEVRRAREARHEAEERFRLLVDSVQDYAIVVLDSLGRVVNWNLGAARINGYQEAEVLGRDAAMFYPPEAIAAGEPARVLIAAADGRDESEGWRVRKGGELFWAHEITIPLRRSEEEAPFGFAKICRDLTSQKTLEETRSALFQAEQAARQEAETANAAKDRFLAALSHELRTPLTPVAMALYALEREKRLSVRGRELITLMRENIKMETQLIDDLLDVGRIVHGKLDLRTAPLDLHAAVRQGLEICHGDLAGKNLELVVELNAAEHWVAGDITRLQQIFWNLVKNAAKFTPAEGRVVVRSHNPVPGRIAVEVADTGIGLEPAALEKIFNPFEQGSAQTMRHYGGLGLGLAIARAIAEAHGGQLTAASAGADQGATFTVDLAASPEPEKNI